MKKTVTILAAAALVLPSVVNAAENATVTAGTTYHACDGGTATKYDQYGGPGNPVAGGTTFVKVGFSVQCSASTFVSFVDMSPTLFVVGSGSAKGNQSFKGSSNGGAVVTHTKCTGTNLACTQNDVTAAASAASSM